MEYKNIIKKIWKKSRYSKEKSDSFGEVFTPKILIEKMISKSVDLEAIDWKNPDLKLLDYCSGNGNISSVYLETLMESLSDKIENPSERYRHIVENMIYIIEYQRENAKFISESYNPTGELKMNIYVGDGLLIPEEYWDLEYEDRVKKYPQHQIDSEIPAELIFHGSPDNKSRRSFALF